MEIKKFYKIDFKYLDELLSSGCLGNQCKKWLEQKGNYYRFSVLSIFYIDCCYFDFNQDFDITEAEVANCNIQNVYGHMDGSRGYNFYSKHGYKYGGDLIASLRKLKLKKLNENRLEEG